MPKKSIFKHVGDTPIIPISAKIVTIFISLLLLSNAITNFINLRLSQKQVIELTNEVLVNQLKDMYTTAGNQYQISLYSQDRESALKSLSDSAKTNFSEKHSLALGVRADGKIIFSSCADESQLWTQFTDKDALIEIVDKSNMTDSIKEGSINFSSPYGDYFGVYKFNEDWQCFLIRAEFRADTQRDMYRVMLIIGIIILVLTVLFLYIGITMFNRLFENVNKITKSLYDMQKRQSLDLIDISDAPNDDITYLATSFNALSSDQKVYLEIFQKFASRDVVQQVYNDRCVKLEGQRRELAILFSDIKSFTYRTETLGNEIIGLLNVHYNSVIRIVDECNGVVGSIIGDAILAIYGSMSKNGEQQSYKSCEAIESAWQITNVTAQLREKMTERRRLIEKERPLSESEEKVFKAVMLDIGVGIDGGTVFYGNIGADEHMANTVIGDRVNSASRLEGLTRIYHLPVIVSEYIRDEAMRETDRYIFYEIDKVQVKGKTEGVKIYFPFDTHTCSPELQPKFTEFEAGLEPYYAGDWKAARAHFKNCDLEVAQVFLERMGLKKAPQGWNGIWTMTTK